MKICWDNLEKLEYRPDRKQWEKNGHFYLISPNRCIVCNEKYFYNIKYESKCCTLNCVHKYNKNKKRSKKTKENLKNAWIIRKLNGYKVWNKGKIGLQEGMKKENSPNWNGGYNLRNIPRYDTYAHQISYAESVRKGKNDKNILEIKCAYCGKWFIPKQRNVINRIRALNGKFTPASEYRLYCSDNCKHECPIFGKQKYSAEENNTKRYSREVQPELRQLVFERDNYTCQKCGKHQDNLDCGLHCHHKEGILWEPLESADVDKSITFCKDCHKEIHKLPDCGYHDLRCKRENNV